MLRRDFISKVIEQMLNVIARMLKLNVKEEPQKFLDDFEELLQTYFKLKKEELSLLLEDDKERDSLLLDEKLKNYQIKLFIQAGFAFMYINESGKAKFCVEIIRRIQHQHRHLFEFPSEENSKLNQDLVELKNLISEYQD